MLLEILNFDSFRVKFRQFNWLLFGLNLFEISIKSNLFENSVFQFMSAFLERVPVSLLYFCVASHTHFYSDPRPCSTNKRIANWNLQNTSNFLNLSSQFLYFISQFFQYEKIVLIEIDTKCIRSWLFNSFCLNTSTCKIKVHKSG